MDLITKTFLRNISVYTVYHPIPINDKTTELSFLVGSNMILELYYFIPGVQELCPVSHGRMVVVTCDWLERRRDCSAVWQFQMASNLGPVDS